MPPTTAKQLVSSDLSLPPDTYIYSLARTTLFAAAISSDDSLRYFDPKTLALIHTVPNAHGGITCLKGSSDGKGLVTAGRDGIVRCWDERAPKVVGLQMSEPRGAGISALACHETYIAAGTESTKEGLGDVSVLLWDTRNTTTPLQTYTESHTDTITQLCFHPSNPHTLLSASTDGLLSIFNTSISDEDDAVVQVLNHHAAIAHAGFLSNTEVYALSSDEQLSVYTLSEPATEQVEVEEDDVDEVVLPVVAFGDVRQSLQSSYVVDVFVGATTTPGGRRAWVASGNAASNTLTMVPLKPSWAFDTSSLVSFPKAHGDELVRDFLIDDENQRIITCGEDGKIRLWAQQEQEQQSKSAESTTATTVTTDAMEIDGSAKGDKKKKLKNKKKKDRFTPY